MLSIDGRISMAQRQERREGAAGSFQIDSSDSTVSRKEAKKERLVMSNSLLS